MMSVNEFLKHSLLCKNQP